MCALTTAIAAALRTQRRNLANTDGVICITFPGAAFRSDEARHQVRELHQIGRAKQRARPAEDDLRIGRDDVSPPRWHRADVIVVDTKKQPRAVAVVPLADADELPSAERVKGMRDAHKARPQIRRASSSS